MDFPPPPEFWQEEYALLTENTCEKKTTKKQNHVDTVAEISMY